MRYGSIGIVLLGVALSFSSLLARPLKMGPEARTIKTKHFRIEYEPQQEQLAKRLAKRAEAQRKRLCRMYVDCFASPTLVQIATDQRQFLDIQPGGAHIDWAAGVAYSEMNLVILRVDRSMMLSIEETLVHEISHILLLNYVKERPPRWFIEGLAIFQAEQDLIQRFESVAAATVSDSVLPFKHLDAHFPNSAKGRSLAYAQSGVFFRYLVNRFGESGVRKLLESLRHGTDFERAVHVAFGVPLGTLEGDWIDSLHQYGWVKALTSEWMLWSLMSLLAFVALWAARRRIRKGKARMEEEEREWRYITHPGDE